MGIQPRLNRLDITMIIIDLVIGMGIFIPSITGIKAANYEQATPRHQLICMYIGLEDADYLIKVSMQTPKF
jgi:hypothetical protein